MKYFRNNGSLTLVLTLPQSFYVFQGWSLQLSQLHFPYLPREGLGLREWMSSLSCSLHGGEESSQHWHRRENQEAVRGHYMLKTQEGVWVSPKGNHVNSQVHRPMGMTLLVLLERGEESRLIYPRSLGCEQLVPQSLSKGRGGFYSVGASGRNRLSTPWWWQLLSVRGGGNIIPFEEDSLPPLIYLLLPSDSVIQPQNQSPEEGRKSPALKDQCPCEVLLCGTFLKNNHIRRLSGWGNPQTTLWGLWKTR